MIRVKGGRSRGRGKKEEYLLQLVFDVSLKLGCAIFLDLSFIRAALIGINERAS